MESENTSNHRFPSSFVNYVYPIFDEVFPQPPADSEVVFDMDAVPLRPYPKIDLESAPAAPEDVSHLSDMDADSSVLSAWQDSKRTTEGGNSFVSTTTAGSFLGAQTLCAPDCRAAQEGEPSKIDSTLDFIFSSVKRNHCYDEDAGAAGDRAPRTHKSKEQVEILQKELADASKVTMRKIKEVAAKAGLKKSQVYKWYWDCQKRTQLAASHR